MSMHVCVALLVLPCTILSFLFLSVPNDKLFKVKSRVLTPSVMMYSVKNVTIFFSFFLKRTVSHKLLSFTILTTFCTANNIINAILQ